MRYGRVCLVTISSLALLGSVFCQAEVGNMSLADDETKVKEAHGRYFQALGAGDMEALAANFTFPAAFKGFLDDVAIATDKESLASTYERLIAAAPKAARTEVRGLDVGYLRPGVYMLTMSYEQYDEDDALIHDGRAVYVFKKVGDEFKLCAVL